MQYYMPVKLFSETNCIANHKKELQGLGTKALIVTGKHSSKKNGSLAHMEEALDSCGIPYFVFDEIEENPSMETVMKARDYGIEVGADFVVGIGGGSPLDASKAISMMMKHPEYSADALYDKEKACDAFPIACVPTTAGTGSEATPYSILTQHKNRTKQSLPHKIFPQIAFIDEQYLRSVPPHILADTAVDALAHLIESYINTNAQSYSEMLSLRGLELWGMYCKEGILKPETDADTRSRLFEASTIAGMAISHTGTSLPHALSYKLTYEIGMAHGRAVGVFLPNYLRFCPDTERVQTILSLLGFASIEVFSQYLMTCFPDTTVPEELCMESARAVAANPGKLKNCPYPVDAELLGKIAHLF